MRLCTNDIPADMWLIEDNASDILLARMILEDEDVQAALMPLKGGQAACERIKQHDGTLPDAIFMDLNMPDISGSDILKILRADARFNDVPVFILSGSDAESDRKTACAMGANGYITKPLSRVKILQAVTMTSRLCAKEEGKVCHIMAKREAVPA